MKLSSRVQLLLALTMSIASVFSLISGVGTVCLAFKPDKFPMFPGLAPYSTQLQIITVVTLLVGFVCAILAYAFIRGEKWAYIASLIVLVIGLVFGAWHMYISLAGRGSSTPGNLRVIVDVIAIVILIIVRLPMIWNKIDITHPLGSDRGSYNNPIGMAFALVGLGLLSTPLYTSASHTFGEINLIDALLPELYIIGGGFLLAGISFMIMSKFGLNIERGLAFISKKAFANKA